ncbi:MBOAT family O-acyltransferase [Pseudomonas lopnurensis]|uniref:MBOAT family O-acyltransferase n=1 Tax=Pseudomonas lopnurensis TaxID=1477517 RepID=UPI0028B07A52|nr:MBOAT family O-acyltransferase [Pseudomonas lopnurensis]
MLFNSVEFIAGFLPVVLIGFIVLTGSGRQRLAVIWLTVVSLVFYGWWNPAYVPLLVGSMLFNYLLGGHLRQRPSRLVLGLAVLANVLLLGYYKYTGFLFANLDEAFGLGWRVDDIILPLAISFFTFQQIAYLVDAHDGVVEEHDFANYCLFISFFPQLIAGPITHHGEMLAQFRDSATFRARLDSLSLGATVFLLGLFKKVVVADTLALKATPVFALAADGGTPSLYDAWTGALTYTLQIYFDFSGYSDMAIGLALLFGIALPVNFNSPFKARNVIEYWSRWHMTLTRFLTAYIYNPIVLRVTRARMAAGKPQPRRGRMTAGTFFALVAYPTVFTMFISGIWHGAGWQFVAFGLLHGFYLVAAHGWRAWKVRQGWQLDSTTWWHQALAVLLTFLCVVVAMVFFRAANVSAAMSVLTGMLGLSPSSTQLDRTDFVYIAALLVFVWGMPNIQQWMGHFRTALNFQPQPHWTGRWLPFGAWRPAPVHGVAVGVLGFFALAIAFSMAPTEFLYFQF